MKKKKLKKLSLNKIKISKIENAGQIKGGDTALVCTVTVTITIGSQLLCSLLAGSCDCPEPPEPVLEDPDNTRGCPSWNVAC